MLFWARRFTLAVQAAAPAIGTRAANLPPPQLTLGASGGSEAKVYIGRQDSFLKPAGSRRRVFLWFQPRGGGAISA